jgi:hypothetical protein
MGNRIPGLVIYLEAIATADTAEKIIGIRTESHADSYIHNEVVADVMVDADVEEILCKIVFECVGEQAKIFCINRVFFRQFETKGNGLAPHYEMIILPFVAE